MGYAENPANREKEAHAEAWAFAGAACLRAETELPHWSERRLRDALFAYGFILSNGAWGRFPADVGPLVIDEFFELCRAMDDEDREFQDIDRPHLN